MEINEKQLNWNNWKWANKIEFKKIAKERGQQKGLSYTKVEEEKK